ncbi:uncharacterized protein LOC132637257 [Lycium barbarum]|uniref:uncharacterized protein LOC132637257 n=1 Tax=Lycium barbarum TaxID=112863 RepID=UPI00293F3009|nr:uncharacterized protein LOC132637257 [Lycium barbarum]
MVFESKSGLHINMLKINIYPVNEVPNLEELADILSYNIGSLPTTYLGLPLGAKFKSIDIWNSVIERMEKRLATWQIQYLSLGGRLTLINSVLDSIPTYIMSLFPMPRVTLPKSQGGLWIRNLKLHNKSLLIKWLWRFSQPEAGYWKDIIVAKYDAQNHWYPKRSREPHGVGVWKHICSLLDEFTQKVSFKAGNGHNVKFWKDLWLGNTTLKASFPKLFQIAC